VARDPGLLTDAGPETHAWGTAPDFVGPRHELREKLLLDLFLAVAPGRRALNVGAGLGSFSQLLEERGFDVVSTDVATAALDLLRERVRGTVVEASMTDLPFSERSFDAVVAGEVLEHIEEDRRALGEVARVLVPGGVLALSVPAHPEWFGSSDHWAGHVRRYTRARLTEAVEGSGLTLERIRPWGFPVSALYHRAVYDKRAAALASRRQKPRIALRVLRVAVQVDRLFVGVERGCLGYLAIARRTESSF